jgi:hypothetical protein
MSLHPCGSLAASCAAWIALAGCLAVRTPPGGEPLSIGAEKGLVLGRVRVSTTRRRSSRRSTSPWPRSRSRRGPTRSTSVNSCSTCPSIARFRRRSRPTRSRGPPRAPEIGKRNAVSSRAIRGRIPLGPACSSSIRSLAVSSRAGRAKPASASSHGTDSSSARAGRLGRARQSGPPANVRFLALESLTSLDVAEGARGERA